MQRRAPRRAARPLREVLQQRLPVAARRRVVHQVVGAAVGGQQPQRGVHVQGGDVVGEEGAELRLARFVALALGAASLRGAGSLGVECNT